MNTNTAVAMTFISEKGGCTKSSSCFHTGWEYALRGHKVLLIDLEGQQSANLTFLTGIEKNSQMKTIMTLFSSPSMDTKDVVQNVTTFDNGGILDIIPANNQVSLEQSNARISSFRKIVKSVRNSYDWILVDVRSSGWTHWLALSVCDYAIPVLLPDAASVEATKGLIESIIDIKENTNPSLSVLGFLFNKNVENTLLSKSVHEGIHDLTQILSDITDGAIVADVFDSKIRNSTAMAETVICFKGITSYKPKSPVAGDVRNLVSEMEGRILNGK